MGRSDFKRSDNCFTWLGTPALAQRLMNQPLTADWPRALCAIARSLNPLHEKIFAPLPMDYYWTAYQIGFRNRDIRGLLHSAGKNPSPTELRRLSARTSRQLRLLRAHGVIRKIPKSHSYRLTARGRILTAALFAALGVSSLPPIDVLP